jgi:hypothetical protein
MIDSNLGPCCSYENKFDYLLEKPVYLGVLAVLIAAVTNLQVRPISRKGLNDEHE